MLISEPISLSFGRLHGFAQLNRVICYESTLVWAFALKVIFGTGNNPIFGSYLANGQVSPWTIGSLPSLLLYIERQPPPAASVQAFPFSCLLSPNLPGQYTRP